MATPRRSLRGDLLAALAAVSLLALAVVFAVVLTADSLRSNQEPQTATVESMVPTQPATGMPILTATLPEATTVAPTTVVLTTAAPATVAPKASATLSTTEIELPATTAAAAPSTGTASPGAAGSPTARATRPATATATLTSSPTRRPPSATPSPTRTPSATPTNTFTPSPTLTATPLPTDTAVYTATLTSNPPAIGTPPPQDSGACAIPAGWQPYAIQSGDNLFRLSIRAGISTSELQQANCIPNAASIRTGQVIYVPPAFFGTGPAAPAGIATPMPGAPSGQTEVYPLRLGCLLTQVQISSPLPNSVITARTSIYGAATLSDTASFSFYKLELRGLDGVYRNLSQSTSPASGPSSLLGLLDPSRFPAGEYQLVLTVVESSGNFPEPCAIRIYLGH